MANGVCGWMFLVGFTHTHVMMFTAFTLVGVINKCLTIMLNYVMWDQHAPIGGILCLGLCLVGGSVYRQAPMRSEVAKNVDNDELAEALVTVAEDDNSTGTDVTLESLESQEKTNIKRRGS